MSKPKNEQTWQMYISDTELERHIEIYSKMQERNPSERTAETIERLEAEYAKRAGD